MISNLADVVQNIIDLIEMKKDRLRLLHDEAESLKLSILELEDARFKLSSNNSSNITVIPREVSIYKAKGKRKDIKSADVLAFIVSSSYPVSYADIREHFQCKSEQLSCISYLIQMGKVIRNGVNDKGKQTYSSTLLAEKIG